MAKAKAKNKKQKPPVYNPNRRYGYDLGDVELISYKKIKGRHTLNRRFEKAAEADGVLDANLAQEGFWRPMIVTGKYEVLAGGRKYESAGRLGFEQVPVQVLKAPVGDIPPGILRKIIYGDNNTALAYSARSIREIIRFNYKQELKSNIWAWHRRKDRDPEAEAPERFDTKVASELELSTSQARKYIAEIRKEDAAKKLKAGANPLKFKTAAEITAPVNRMRNMLKITQSLRRHEKQARDLVLRLEQKNGVAEKRKALAREQVNLLKAAQGIRGQGNKLQALYRAILDSPRAGRDQKAVAREFLKNFGPDRSEEKDA